MNIHLATDYGVQPQFYPVYSLSGQLVATELRVNFCHLQSQVVIPQSLLTPQLDIAQRIALLQKHITLIESAGHFFSANNVSVTLSVDELLADTLLESDFLQKKTGLLDGLQLEISENFPALSNGIRDARLKALSENFSLVLSNYGAGQATSKAVFDGVFDRVCFDRHFIQRLLKRGSFAPLMGAMLDQLRPCCGQLILRGADHLVDLQSMRQLPVDGVQGALFPPVQPADLPSLLFSPPWLAPSATE